EGARRRPVAPPELAAHGRLERGEEDRATERREAARVCEARAGVEVLDQDGARGGAVRLPQLDTERALDSVAGREEEAAARRREVPRVPVARAALDVLHEEGHLLCAGEGQLCGGEGEPLQQRPDQQPPTREPERRRHVLSSPGAPRAPLMRGSRYTP